jgi:hypothetical protein
MGDRRIFSRAQARVYSPFALPFPLFHRNKNFTRLFPEAYTALRACLAYACEPACLLTIHKSYYIGVEYGSAGTKDRLAKLITDFTLVRLQYVFILKII